MRESSSTAVRVRVSACVVESAAVDTPLMLSAVFPEPAGASVPDRELSLAEAVCYYIALAVVAW